ncbi:hypothetical protein [Mumia zhuanghuii]|uniref:Uncharacterized protein n=1 Tax=Mumia zhuanghuii TaxID=2585211 RepID=A0A5C4M9K7_9ACTN|nr:hypothetical protein [Mumia zhuanghuii]TNC31282.1 hypothetical protein FHE65_31915 [Mumia zhuanghuii]
MWLPELRMQQAAELDGKALHLTWVTLVDDAAHVLGLLLQWQREQPFMQLEGLRMDSQQLRDARPPKLVLRFQAHFTHGRLLTSWGRPRVVTEPLQLR